MNRTPPTGSAAEVTDATIDACVLETVSGAPDRLTPIELKRRVRAVCRSIGRGRIESAVKRLVEQKELVYTYQFGTSFLERSFDKPVRVTGSMVLKPPACTHDPLPGDIVINIKAGAAFGTGCHPTTRLSLAGLGKVGRDYLPGVEKKGKRVLDIGTGSGVLAIAALKLGLEQGIGLDIDSCARAEALENAGLNGLSRRLEITDGSLDILTGRFFLITANLRLPTLIAYFDRMAALMEKGGVLVVSGIKQNEINSLKRASDLHDMRVCWEGKELGWAAMVLRQVEQRTEK